MSRVFQGCRVLMAAAKSSSSAPTGIMKLQPTSPALKKFVGAPEICRPEAVKKIWDHIRSNKEDKLNILRELTLVNHGKFQKSVSGSIPSRRCMTTAVHPGPSFGDGNASVSPDTNQTQRIKFKRLDKTAKHIMNILDKEAVEKVRADREIPDIQPGYIIQLKVEVPENKRRVSIVKGIVIARRNAGLNTTFRLRRMVAGIGVESVFPLYSPNIKEMKVLEKKKVRRAKLYYLRDRMNALKK